MPLVKPVTVADAVVDVPSANVVHVKPESEEYCTTKAVMHEPPDDAGATHVKATVVLPPVPETVVGAPGVAAVHVASRFTSADTVPLVGYVLSGAYIAVPSSQPAKT